MGVAGVVVGMSAPPATSRMLRAMGWARSFIRLWVITFVVGFYAFRYGMGRLATLLVAADRRKAAVSALRGRILRRAMTRLGAGFVKLGQVMSTRPDILEPETIFELRKLQDELPSFPMAKARAIIRGDLGGVPEDHYSELDNEPVAAASVAQVHRGRLLDGTEVAVKILRPDIREKTARDSRIMLLGARVLMLHPAARASDLYGHLEHFVAGILAQTDLTIEAENYRRFRENFRGYEGVFFPAVYGEKSGPRVLTMDFVRGTKIDDLGPGDHSALAMRLRNAMFKMLFDDGFLHADLHPGNFVITAEGEVAIFDVGLAKLLSEEVLEQYIDWNKCLVMGTPDDHVEHIKRYFVRSAGTIDWDELRKDVEIFTGKFRGKRMADIEIQDIVNGAFAIGRKHGLRPVTEMTLIMVGVVTAEGVGKQLDADTDALAAIAQYLQPILVRRGLI